MKEEYPGLYAIKIPIDENVFTSFSSSCYATINFRDIANGCEEITHDPKQLDYTWHDDAPN